LARANAFLITHADDVDDATRAAILETLRRYNAAAPVYQCNHAPTHFKNGDSAAIVPLESLGDRRWFAFCGIGQPESFF
jgi:hypothetical protein